MWLGLYRDHRTHFEWWRLESLDELLVPLRGLSSVQWTFSNEGGDGDHYVRLSISCGSVFAHVARMYTFSDCLMFIQATSLMQCISISQNKIVTQRVVFTMGDIHDEPT